MKYIINISTDDASYGDCTDAQIEQIKSKIRAICEERNIEYIEVDPMVERNHIDGFETDVHPDADKIFEEAIYSI